MIGIDIVKIERFEKFIEKYDKKGLEKFLDKDEIALVKTASNVAGFFAAKEAVSKALKTGISKECSFKDIKIHKNSNNAPYFTLSKNIIEKLQIKETSLSITHDGGFAIAVAVIISSLQQTTKISH